MTQIPSDLDIVFSLISRKDIEKLERAPSSEEQRLGRFRSFQAIKESLKAVNGLRISSTREYKIYIYTEGDNKTLSILEIRKEP